MSLRERIKGHHDANGNGESLSDYGQGFFQALKGRIHNQLINRIDLTNLFKVDRKHAHEEIRKILQELITQEKIPIN